MSLPDLLRLFGSVARSVRGSALSPHDTSQMTLRVMPEDLDIFGHVTNARYLSLLNLGRGDWVIRTGLMKVALRRRAPLLAGRIDVSYLAPLGPFARFELATRALHWNEKWFFFEHRMTSAGSPVAVALVRALFRGSRGNIAPAEMLAAAGQPAVSPPLTDALRTWSSQGVDRSS